MDIDRKKYLQTHIIGQVQYLKENLIVTEPLPVVERDEIVDVERAKGWLEEVEFSLD